LAVAGLLAWFVSSDLSRQPQQEPDVVPETVVTVAARDFAEQFADASVPTRALINGRVFNLEVANDVASRSLGLGGRFALAEDSGMLFVFPGEGFHSFWMKDTRIPLDLLYIAGDGTIVDIQRMEPEPGVPDADLTIYQPPMAVLLALEINGGLAQRHGITAGMAVSFE
jgi:uncharacterized membrane protein (UPF0127 family)